MRGEGYCKTSILAPGVGHGDLGRGWGHLLPTRQGQHSHPRGTETQERGAPERLDPRSLTARGRPRIQTRVSKALTLRSYVCLLAGCKS